MNAALHPWRTFSLPELAFADDATVVASRASAILIIPLVLPASRRTVSALGRQVYKEEG